MRVPFNLSAFAIRAARCPICGPALFIKFAEQEIAVRCIRCRATPITLSIVSALRTLIPELGTKAVLELSSRGPLVKFLGKTALSVTTSEYFDGVEPGEFKGAIQCQDVQCLTYEDQCFDVCTSTEVFEHVPDDRMGFSEVHRVLKPGGAMLFTVPLGAFERTVERAEIRDGRVHYLLPAEYHGDRIRGASRVLCYRDYGLDIVERLREAGFADAKIIQATHARWFTLDRAVVVGFKKGS